MEGDNWQLGAVAVVMSSILAGCSLVSYYAILVDISTEEERDRASSRGWAFGYLGGGVLLLINLVIVLEPGHCSGSTRGWRCGSRCSRRPCGGPGFTIIPFVRLRNYAPVNVVPVEGGVLQRSFGQLVRHPQATCATTR